MAHWSSADGPTGARCLVVQVVQVSQVRVVEDTVEIPRLADRGDIVDTCPLCRRWSRLENLCPQNPYIPMFVTAPDAPLLAQLQLPQ